MTVRKLSYYIAMSLDGFISRTDGRIDDFSFEGEHVPDLLAEYPETIPTHLRSHFDLTNENRQFDTVLMGRRTYEVGLELGVTNPYQHLRQYVFSRSLQSLPDNDVNLISSNAIDAVQKLKAEDGLGIWLCGGPELASTLLGEIDELILKVNPFLMGAGKTLFAFEFPKRELQLVTHHHYDNGFSLLHYKFERPD